MVADVIDGAGIIGIGSIEDAGMTGKQQCMLFTTEYLYMIIKAFKDMKAKQVYVTVEKDKPILIGGKKNGIILAARIE